MKKLMDSKGMKIGTNSDCNEMYEFLRCVLSVFAQSE